MGYHTTYVKIDLTRVKVTHTLQDPERPVTGTAGNHIQFVKVQGVHEVYIQEQRTQACWFCLSELHWPRMSLRLVEAEGEIWFRNAKMCFVTAHSDSHTGVM